MIRPVPVCFAGHGVASVNETKAPGSAANFALGAVSTELAGTSPCPFLVILRGC